MKEEEIVPLFKREWSDVVGVDIGEEVKIRWLLQYLTPGVGILDRT